jgi:hypothetical protein
MTTTEHIDASDIHQGDQVVLDDRAKGTVVRIDRITGRLDVHIRRTPSVRTYRVADVVQLGWSA